MDRRARGASRRAVSFTLVALLVALSAVARAAEASKSPFGVEEVARGVFVHRGRTVALDAPGHDDIANIGFILGSRCVAVVDTGGSMRIGRALRAAIEARTKTPICYVIDTHVHVDHVLGNAAFVEDHPKFVGHAKLAGEIARNRSYFVEHYAGDLDAPAGETEIVGPDVLVADTKKLDLGDRTIELRVWPKAHTDCDLTVYVPDVRLLWTGDLLFRERIPALDGSITGWLAAIDGLSKRSDVAIAIPGHGPVTHDLASALAPERAYLQAIATGVRAELAAGESLEHATEHVALDRKSQWKLWDTAHAHNVSVAYRELEWE